MTHTQQYKDQPIKRNRPSLLCKLMEWNFAREKKHKKIDKTIHTVLST
jgi:hypothetical protein